ncbi:zinc-finger domain-containing protein [uncultured Cohaesibacter sp.]|uniref:zinc-finger domain-containing protein n=1 Tax=uncultured Cohaesibacter sp. TaxID=1002546 RepID=UPI0029C96930|nr:zinc-finger domain-containing protein [uncultured Cohaesibacter sp.]
MADHKIPHFKNDEGVSEIEIGVREFQCMGATPPQDHPHVYLDMGHDDEILCPYCSTHYKYNQKLGPTKSIPSGCYHE